MLVACGVLSRCCLLDSALSPVDKTDHSMPPRQNEANRGSQDRDNADNGEDEMLDENATIEEWKEVSVNSFEATGESLKLTGLFYLSCCASAAH
jgi:hypothetical protein